MTEQNATPTPEESYDLEGSGSNGGMNPWASRTLKHEAFYLGAVPGTKASSLPKDKEPRSFVIRRTQLANLYGGVEFRIQTGLRADMSPIGRPFYSAARLHQGWLYKNKKGKMALGIKNPPVTLCPLARLVQTHPELIVPQMYQGKMTLWPDGNPKQDYKKLFALEMYEVLTEYKEVPDPKHPGMTMRVNVVDPVTRKPKFTVNPKPYLWHMNEAWWEQLRAKVLAPGFAAAMEPTVTDIDGVSSSAAAKQLPAAAGPDANGKRHPEIVVLKLWAKTKKPDGTLIDPAGKTIYEVDFSAGLTIQPSEYTPVEELPVNAAGTIDWDQLYPPMTEEQVKHILATSMNVSSAPADHQESPPPSDTPPPVGDDDIPF